MMFGTAGNISVLQPCNCMGPQQVDGVLQPACPCAMNRPPTPARGEAMPQTREYWEKRAETDQELILSQRDEISGLKRKINKLEQKL